LNAPLIKVHKLTEENPAKSKPSLGKPRAIRPPLPENLLAGQPSTSHSRSSESLHGLQQNIGNSWVASWTTSTSKESTRIAHDHEESKISTLYGKNSSNSKNHQIESDSREIWGQSHQPKRHKVLIRDTQQNPQEIILKTLPRKSQQRALKITTKKDGKSTTQP
jgi:hypothetical protein